MLSSRQTRHVQKILLLAALCLIAYHWLVLSPLARRAESLDAPLSDAWKRLVAAKVGNGSGIGPNLEKLDQRVHHAQSAIAAVEKAQQTVSASIALDASFQSKMKEPFQLVDFENEEQLRIEQLEQNAHTNQVKIAPIVFNSFPEYSAERKQQPGLLWAQLAFLDHLLELAVNCRVSEITNVELPSITGHALPTGEIFVYEIPMRVEFEGSAAAISKLLASLPLRQSETKALGLPEVPASKPALFIHRFIVKKNSPENPDQISLSLRACGFVYAEP